MTQTFPAFVSLFFDLYDIIFSIWILSQGEHVKAMRKLKFRTRRSYWKPSTLLRKDHKMLAMKKATIIIIGTIVIVIAILFASFGPSLTEAVRNPFQKRSVKTMEPVQPTQKPQNITLDLTAGVQTIILKNTRINQPSIYNDEVMYSAGSGSIDQPVLKSLFVYHFSTKIEEQIAVAKVKFGEIFEPLMNADWFIWLDTDQSGINVIMAKDRKSGKEVKVKECKNNKPKLRLYGNTLIWMEQTNDNEDKLYMFDLPSGENMPLATFHNAASYGVSAPCIYKDQVLWAGPDDTQGADEKKTNEKSSINILDLKNLKGGITPVVYKPETYVHEPISNGNAIVWLDGNKSPNARLLMTVDQKNVTVVNQGVTGYALGEDFLVYARNQTIWVYFYHKDETGRLTSPGEKAMLPAVQGRTILWYDITDLKNNKDILKYKILP